MRTQSLGCFRGLRGKESGTGRSARRQKNFNGHDCPPNNHWKYSHCCIEMCCLHLLEWPSQDHRRKAYNSAQGTEHCPTSPLPAPSSIAPEPCQMCSQRNKLAGQTHIFGCHALSMNLARQVFLRGRDVGHVDFSASRCVQGCGCDKSRCV